MKMRIFLHVLALEGFLNFVSLAAAFDCGSTGTNGSLNITTDTTLNMPADGIFNFTTLTVAQGATLSFSNNALNTPVYLLASGDVTINGTIDVSGNGPASIRSWNGSRPNKAGPGGFDGGYGGLNFSDSTVGGDGYGPGRGKRSPGVGDSHVGSYGTVGNANYLNNTNTYGNLLLVPLIGGSGGAGQDGAPGGAGGGGGGAILIAANTRVVINGVVAAKGGDSSIYADFAAGSGGGIRVVAPVVTGTGTLNASGGISSTAGGSSPAGHGRVRIDCTDFLAYRSLNLIGAATRGNRMFIFPTVVPRLDIIIVAGLAIAEGTNNPVQFELSGGASTNQTVTVQARDFTNDVPIRVVVTPRNGPSGQFDGVISQGAGNPPSSNVNVVIPAGSICQIHAWTR
jgi:hypothetical protein